MRSTVIVLSAAALIAASSQPIRADPVRVDQVSSLSAASTASAATAQTPSFLVGISGQLVSLEVFLNRLAAAGPSDGRAGGSATAGDDVSRTLASHTVSPFAAPASTSVPVRFDIASAQLQVIAGRLLAFVEGSRMAGVGMSPPAVDNGAPAGGGAAYLPPNASPSARLGGVSFAQPDPVPEPTTLALVGSGLVLGALRRRQLRQRKQAGAL